MQQFIFIVAWMFSLWHKCRIHSQLRVLYRCIYILHVLYGCIDMLHVLYGCICKLRVLYGRICLLYRRTYPTITTTASHRRARSWPAPRPRRRRSPTATTTLYERLAPPAVARLTLTKASARSTLTTSTLRIKRCRGRCHDTLPRGIRMTSWIPPSRAAALARVCRPCEGVINKYFTPWSCTLNACEFNHVPVQDSMQAGTYMCVCVEIYLYLLSQMPYCVKVTACMLYFFPNVFLCTCT